MSSSQRQFNFYQPQPYSIKLLKGITRDEVFSQLKKYSLLMKYYHKNQKQTQNRIIDTLMRQPSQADCPGFIYGFKDYNQHQQNPFSQNFEIKMGRTKRQVPQDRIYQWESEDSHQYVELFTIRSQHNNKLESLVHLFFAYARKVKFINGKRRIEWFTFQEKALNSAVVAMINQLMEYVHQMGKRNQVNQVKLSFDLDKFCNQILHCKEKNVLQVEFLKKRLILVGLAGSGKSILKALINGNKLISLQAKNIANQCGLSLLFDSSSKQLASLSKNYAIQQKTSTIDIVQGIVEITSSRNISEKDLSLKQKNICYKDLKLIQKCFREWAIINSVQNLSIPCLVVTESDILSSQMVGFRQGLKKLMKNIKICQSGGISNQFQHQQSAQETQYYGIKNSKQQLCSGVESSKNFQKQKQIMSRYHLFLVVSKINPSHQISQQSLKKYFLHNSKLFTQQELNILLNCTVGFTYSPTHEGDYNQQNYEITKLVQKIWEINSIQQTSEDKGKNKSAPSSALSYQYFLSHDPSFSTTSLKVLQQIVHFSYESVSVKLEDYFKSAIRNLIKKFDTELLMKGQGFQDSKQNSLQRGSDQQKSQLQQSLNSLSLIQRKLEYIGLISAQLKSLKLLTRQQEVMLAVKRLQHLLQMQAKTQNSSNKDKLLLQLIAFCQCMIKIAHTISMGTFESSSTTKRQGDCSQEYSSLNSSNSQNNSNSLSQCYSPLYLSSTLIFNRLFQSTNESIIQLKDQINHLIENELKQGFLKLLKQLYSSYDQKLSPQSPQKLLFNSIHEVLFKIMNINEVIESQRVEKNITLQMASHQTLQEEILIKLIDQLEKIIAKNVHLLPNNSTSFENNNGLLRKKQLHFVIQAISSIYDIARKYNLKANSIMSRIREAIFMATKNKAPIQMIKISSENYHQDHDSVNNNDQNNKNYIGNKNNGYKKYSNSNKNNQGGLLINGNTKVIMNKKNQEKNQKLLNYINSKKKNGEELLLMNNQIANNANNANNLNNPNNSNNANNSPNSSNNNNINRNINSNSSNNLYPYPQLDQKSLSNDNKMQLNEQKKSKDQEHSMQTRQKTQNALSAQNQNDRNSQNVPNKNAQKAQQQKKVQKQENVIVISSDSQQQFKTNKVENTQNKIRSQQDEWMDQQDEFKSIPDQNYKSQEQFESHNPPKSKNNPFEEEETVQQYKNKHSYNNRNQQIELSNKETENKAAYDNGYANFVNKLLNNNITHIKQQFIGNYNSLKQFYNQCLFKVEQNNFNQIVFNYFETSFLFDLPSLTLHNSYVILFAKRVVISNKHSLDFKIHYTSRHPNKVNLIVISQMYDNIQNLTIQDNKYGKALMIQLLNRNQNKYKVLEGYYTKNKRNQKKLQQFRIKELLAGYCKIIK